MKKNSIKNIKQKMIVSLVTVILIFNFIFPPRSQAIKSEIADTLQTLVCWIGDSIINLLQESTMGETAVFEDYTTWQQKVNQDNLDNADGLWENFLASCGVFFGSTKLGATIQGLISGDNADYPGPVALIKYSVATIVSNKIPAFDVNFFRPMKELNGKISTAEVLKDVVQKWYYAFRNLAVVALLSILVYLGIRIVLSSAASEKAKYLKTIQNWLTAIVLVFILHYIMAFTLNIIDQVNNALSINIITDDGYDTLMGSMRVAAETSEGYAENLTYTLIYAVLVVYAVMFTFIYLKRTIYLVFLTIIAPLVAVTYPIDKEKDGKSQAFDMWVKEYFFNALLQPIHLLLYWLLVTSADDLVKQNPIFAIVAIGFMIPAEKLIRQMFGMENVGQDSALGGFAGGAMAASALSKLKGAGKRISSSSNKPKNEGNDDKQSNIKMAKLDDVFGNNPNNQDVGSDGNSNIRTQSPNTANANTNANANNTQNEGNTPTNGNNQQATVSQRFRDGTVGQAPNNRPNAEDKSNTNKPARGRIGKMAQGVSNKANQLKSSKAYKGSKSVLRTAGRSMWKNKEKIIRGVSGAALGAAGATIGAAAGIASGNVDNVFKYGALGAGAGSGLSNLAISGVKNVGTAAYTAGKGTKAAFLKGYYDDDKEYQQNVLIPQLMKKNEKNKELQEKYKKAGIDMKTSGGRKALYKNGYVNEADILDALKLQQSTGISDKELVQDAIMSKQIQKFSDVDAVGKELLSRLRADGLNEERANEEKERRMKDIKKLAGLT